TSPEQSKPVPGVEPPQLYGTPRKWRAYVTTRRPNPRATCAGRPAWWRLGSGLGRNLGTYAPCGFVAGVASPWSGRTSASNRAMAKASSNMRRRIGRKRSDELPSMGAAVAECGRSLSGWSGVQHTPARDVSLERVERHRFRQVGAGWPKSPYFVFAACTRRSSSLGVAQLRAAMSSRKRRRPLPETSSSQGESSTPYPSATPPLWAPATRYASGADTAGQES